MSAEATNSPTNVEPAGTSAAAASGPDYAQQWAAAAAMQSYYGAAQQQKQPQLGVAGGVAQNGQQQQATQAATHAYYAQMAQHPNLYAQMWAGPVRHPSVEHPIPESPFRCFFFFFKVLWGGMPRFASPLRSFPRSLLSACAHAPNPQHKH